MKKILLGLLVALPAMVWAQKEEGQIVYLEKINMEAEIDGEMEGMEGMEHFKAMMKEMGKSEKVLYFKGKETLYEDYDGKISNEVSGGSDGMEFQVVMVKPESKVYQNLAKKEVIRQEDFMGKKFLIKEPIEKRKWKIGKEKETILGYQCQKATLKVDTTTHTAWFTTELPLSTGPHGYGQLPGTILKMELNDGQMEITAKNVEFKTIKSGTIVPPKKGKQVTSEEYRAIVDKKTKEMQEEMGGGGGTHIEIRTEER